MKSLLPFTKEHDMFREAFSKFCDKEMVPYYRDWYLKDHQVPKELFKKMGELGYLCTWIPKKYGGLELDPLYQVIMTQETARRGMGCVGQWLHSDIVGPYVNAYGSEEIKEKYLPQMKAGEKLICVAMTEPEVGSDLASIKTTAPREGDYFILNGDKTFITNGMLSDICIVACKTKPELGRKGISLLLVEMDSPGFTRNKLNKVGFHGQDTAELHFNDVKVPVGNLLGEEGKGLNYLMARLQPERMFAAQLAQGQAERALELAVEYAKQRPMFGKHLSDLQHTQFKLANMATAVNVGRTFADAVVMAVINGENVAAEVSMAKYYCTETAFQVSDEALQIHGGHGYCYEEYEIGRLWTDTRIQRVSAGTSEVMQLLVARSLGV